MNIIITMAGYGSRFKELYPDVPKPLIPIDNECMFIKSLNSLKSVFENDTYHFVILDDKKLSYKIHEYCKDMNYFIHSITKVTSGQAETVTIALDYIDNDDPIVIFNCDTLVEGFELFDYCYKYDGCITYFDTDDKDKWSFIAINEYDFVTDIKEKVHISDHATTGLYVFKNKEIYLKYYDKIVNQKNELYISLIYNEMIKNNKRIKAIPTNTVGCYGTPEELDRFKLGYRYMAGDTRGKRIFYLDPVSSERTHRLIEKLKQSLRKEDYYVNITP